MTDPQPDFDFYDTRWEIRNIDDEVVDKSINHEEALSLMATISVYSEVFLFRVETYTAEFKEEI